MELNGKLKITVLYDAIEDREKARATAKGDDFALTYKSVAKALEERGHKVSLLAAGTDLRSLVTTIARDESELVFNLCESLGGVAQHEQHVVALLELMGKQFTGSSALGLTLAQDKALSKTLLHYHGIRYPKFTVLREQPGEWTSDLDFPLFVKPLNQDGSVGIDRNSIVNDFGELKERVSFVHNECGSPALVEEYIEGREIYVGILGNETAGVLPILEWDFSAVPDHLPKIASAEAKWDKESPEYKAPQVFPTDIPEEVVTRIRQVSLDAFRALRVRDYARVDMRLRPPGRRTPRGPSDKWEYFIIEANPNPHLDPKGELALAAREQGLNYPDLVNRIVDLAVERG
ncbi:MAG: D-alanine--D-alanine ligase [Acidobacteria bacterium]|nr:MAG: D-alanine--D-alanine ligase [Acidobacteriota bacterium]